MTLREKLHSATCDCGDDRDCVLGLEALVQVALWLESDEAVMVLVEHQRRDIRSCICGWAELGQMHPRHVLQKLKEKASGLAG